MSRPDRGPNRRILVENQSSPQRCRSSHLPLVTPTTKTAEYQYSSGRPGSNQVTLTYPRGQVRGLGRKLRVGIGTSPHRRRSVDDGNTANPRNPSVQTALSQSSVASVAARIARISQIADRIGECGLKTDSVRAGIGLGLSVDHGITVKPRDFNDSWMPWGAWSSVRWPGIRPSLRTESENAYRNRNRFTPAPTGIRRPPAATP